jgi:hypothetical protein
VGNQAIATEHLSEIKRVQRQLRQQINIISLMADGDANYEDEWKDALQEYTDHPDGEDCAYNAVNAGIDEAFRRSNRKKRHADFRKILSYSS